MEKKEENLRKKLEEMINEYQGNCYWSAEGWGNKVPTEDDLDKEMKLLLDFIEQELDRAREEVLERVALETRANVCECGEKWSETDLGIWVEEELSKLTTK